jgi:hypothetical protein
MYKCITYIFLVSALYTFDLRASSLRISNLTTGDSLDEDVIAGMSMAIKYSIGDSLKIEWNRPALNYWSVNESGVGFRGYQRQPSKHLEKALDSSSFSIAGVIQFGGVSINGTTTSTTSYSFSDPSNNTYPQEINPIVFASLSPPPQIPKYSFSFVAMQELPYQIAIVSSASAESVVQTFEGIERTPSGQPGWEWDYQRVWSKSQDFYSGSEAISFTLIPEPSALSLLAFGLGGLAILRRRRS